MADIVLKDRNGNDVTYEGIETVTFDTTVEGVQSTFTEGVAVEDLEIVPDFSGGDMPVMAAENTLVKSAIIKKPEELRSEHIADGVDIAGIVGTFAGNVKIATGTFTGTTDTIIVTHNLGVVPDLILAFPKSSLSTNGNYTLAAIFGFSSAFKNVYPDGSSQVAVGKTANANYIYTFNKTNCNDYDTDASNPQLIREANEETFLVGTNLPNYFRPMNYTPYTWIAIAGLT